MSAGNMVDLLGDVPASWPQARARINPGGYKIVSVRFREAEFECFSKQVRALGLTHNLALRVAARRIAGFLEIDAETRQLLRQVSNDIGEISLSLSRLSRVAEREGSVDLQKLEEQRLAFGREFSVLDDSLQSLLNVSKRRLDGRALLKDISDL